MASNTKTRKKTFCSVCGCLFAVLLLPIIAATFWGASHETDGKAELIDYIQPVEATKPGVAIAIVLDTSGSMAKKAENSNGDRRADVAGRALNSLVLQLGAWKEKNAEIPLHVGLFVFAGGVLTLRPMQEYSSAGMREIVTRIPAPKGGTALGSAIAVAGARLGELPFFQRHLFVITDGENTAGDDPRLVSAALNARSHGSIQLHCVAFETEAKQFDFVRKTGGFVHSATGADLGTVAERVFTEILAEAPDSVGQAPKDDVAESEGAGSTGDSSKPSPPQPKK